MDLELNSFSFESGLLKKTIAPDTNRAAQSDHSKAKLKSTVKDIEALFIYELLKEMRKSTQGGLLGKGLGNDVYTSLLDMEVAKSMAHRGIGLGDMILKQLTRPDHKSQKEDSLSGIPSEKNDDFPKESPTTGISSLIDAENRGKYGR